MRSGKVIILSSHQDSVRNMAQILRGLGYTITITPNAKETIELAHNLRPQLIFWGDQLNLDAKKAIRGLKEEYFGEDLIIIAISDADKVKLYDRIEAQHYGIDDFLSLNPDPAEIETTINLQHSMRKKIRLHQERAERFRHLSETNFNLMLSQGLEDASELVIDFLINNYPLRFLLFSIYSSDLQDFDYFNLIQAGQEGIADVDSIKKHPVWKVSFFQNGSSEAGELCDTEIIKIFKDWKLGFDKIFQYPLQYKGKLIGTILLAYQDKVSVDAEDELMLQGISQAIAYRITEIRRFYGLGRYRTKEGHGFDEFFRRPSEEEITAFLSRQLIKLLQADSCLYMNYHEGFRFLYPQYLFKGDDSINHFEREKPPVLLIKDFPTFDKAIIDKKTLILNMMQPEAPTEIKQLPGFKNASMNNVVIFVLNVAQTVEGFFVLGRESIIKKYTRREVEDSESLIESAVGALEENQILRQAKLQ